MTDTFAQRRMQKMVFFVAMVIIVVGSLCAIVTVPLRASAISPEGPNPVDAQASREASGSSTTTEGRTVKDIVSVDVFGQAANFLAKLIFSFVSLVSRLVLIFINIFLGVALYNGFSESQAVIQGWRIVRDVANMFMVIILLIIAFGTVLKINSYHFRTLIGKFVLFALLINFSNMIVLFYTDFAQVVMLTFVDAFSQHFQTVFIEGFQWNNITSFSGTASKSVSGYTALLSAVLAFIFMIIMLVVAFILAVILLFRIVMLWFLIVISPLPFLLSVFPGAKSYAGQYWNLLTKYLISGPVLAFFLWMSIAVMNVSNGQPSQEITRESGNQLFSEATASPTGIPASLGVADEVLTKIGESGNIMSFIMSGAMIFASLMLAQSFSVVGGNLADKFAGKLQSSAFGLKYLAKNPATSGLGHVANRYYKDTLTGRTGLGQNIRKNAFGRVATNLLKYTTKSGREGFRARHEGLMKKSDDEVRGASEDFTNDLFTRGWRVDKMMTKKGRADLKQMKIPQIQQEIAHMRNMEEYVQEYKGMSKERRAQSTREIWKLGGSEGMLRREALLMSAASEGQVEDLMNNPETIAEYEKIGRDKLGYTDGTYYDENLAGQFMRDLIEGKQAGTVNRDNAKDETAMVLNRLEDYAKQNARLELGGHATTDSKTGKDIITEVDAVTTTDDGVLMGKNGKEIELDVDGNIAAYHRHGSGKGTYVGKNSASFDEGTGAWTVNYKDKDGTAKTLTAAQGSDLKKALLYENTEQVNFAIGDAKKRKSGREGNQANPQEDVGITAQTDKDGNLVTDAYGRVAQRWNSQMSALGYKKRKMYGPANLREIQHHQYRKPEAHAPGTVHLDSSSIKLQDRHDLAQHEANIGVMTEYQGALIEQRLNVDKGDWGNYRMFRVDASDVPTEDGKGKVGILYADTETGEMIPEAQMQELRKEMNGQLHDIVKKRKDAIDAKDKVREEELERKEAGLASRLKNLVYRTKEEAVAYATASTKATSAGGGSKSSGGAVPK